MNGCLGSRFVGRILLFCLLAGFFGLESASWGQDRIARILTGVETDDFESVGIVGSVRRGGFCTGTMITDSHVLTAAHCAEVIDSQTSGTFEVAGQLYRTSDIWIHPQYNSITLANDIAILELSEPVLTVTPSLIFRDEPLVGDILSIVGFGGAGNGNDGSDGTFGTKRVGVTTIDDVTDTLVSWVFDDISEANTAAGDSGGPGFIDIEGQWYIACITSGGTEPDSSLGDFAFNTRVDAYADWIDETVAFSMMDDEDPPSDDEPSDDEPSDDEPSDDEPSDDEPSDDEPSDDEPQEDDSESQSCGSFLGGLFDNAQSSPFPFLQFVIDLFTALIDWLTDDAAEAATETPVADDRTTVRMETKSEVISPIVAVTVVSTSEPGLTNRTTTPVTATEVEPIVEQPEVATNEHGSKTSGQSDSSTTDFPSTGNDASVEPVPSSDASVIEIRRWMIRNPARRHLVRHRI